LRFGLQFRFSWHMIAATTVALFPSFRLIRLDRAWFMSSFKLGLEVL